MIKSSTSAFGRHSYKYFTLMSVIYVTIILLTLIIENHLVIFGSVRILSGTLILPLAYAISDVITEIYGYYQMRRLIWTSIIALYFSAFIIYILMLLPTDTFDQKNTAYFVVFGPFLNDVLTYSIAALTSVFLNSYLLSKWKILIAGRLFWLRSLGATMIGEAIFILIWGFLGFSNKFPMHELIDLMLTSYMFKIIYNIFAIIPTSLLVNILNAIEIETRSSDEINYNPFTWNIN